LLSTFAFEFNLRRFIKVDETGVEWCNQEVLTFIGIDPEAGAYTRPLFGSTVHSLA
jgi:hypothetical protein